MDTTFRLATEAELDALAEVRRLRLALAGIMGHAEYAAGIASSQEDRDAHTRVAEQAREALAVDLDRALTWTFCCVTCEASAVTPTGHSPVGWIVVTWTDCIGEYQEDWYCPTCEAPAARALADYRERELRAEAAGRGG